MDFITENLIQAVLWPMFKIMVRNAKLRKKSKNKQHCRLTVVG